MLDIRLVREHPDSVREGLASRGGGDEAGVDELLRIDRERRGLQTEVESCRARRRQVSRDIGRLIGRGEAADGIREEMRRLGERISGLEKDVTALAASQRELMLSLPNLPHESVARGASAADNPVIRHWGERFEGRTPDHLAICRQLGLVDFERGARLSGSGFVLYTGWGARLERALINYMLHLHTTAHGYTEVSPPFVVGHHCMEGVGQFPKFADQAYAVRSGGEEEGRLWLVPTAEAPVANIHREEILPFADLPLRYCAYSPCFRAEAGAAGVGTRGMIRMHQFDKVELIAIVPPEEGFRALEGLVGHAERVLRELELPYRVVLLCTGDMGFGSAKTYDLEVWAPGQADWLEVSSCSNCGDFQSRRMGLRYRTPEGRNRHPHVLNGSGTALARVFVALLETHRREDGSVRIPGALQPFLHAAEIPAPAA